MATTDFKTSFDCDRLQSLWICVFGKKGSQRASARFRALLTSGLDHKLFARPRHKTGFETSCQMILSLLLAIVLALTGIIEGADRPNILLILVDDVGYCDVAAFGARLHKAPADKLFYETPRIDQLARQGTMFTQFYACTVCAPTRASLMTGKMSNRMGMWDAYAATKTTFEKTGKPLPDGCHVLDHEPWDEYRYSKTDRGVSVPIAATALHDVKTIPQGLIGYHTVFMGKWHLGSQHHPGYRPEDQGFDQTLAYFDGGGSGYHRPFRAYAARTQQWDKPGPNLTPQQDYLSDDVAQRVNRFLADRAANHAEEPFFLYLAHPAAHGPIQSRADDLAYFQAKAQTPGWIGHQDPAYAGLIRGMDRSIGQILDKLDQLKLSDNTAVVFISDNGGHPVFTRNTPLRGGKSMLYEGGIRVPMIVRWPGRTRPGTVCDVTSDIADIYPTLMDIAGVDYSDYRADRTTDGQSLVPLLGDLENKSGAYTREAFYQFYGKLGYQGFHNFATWATLRQGDYKLHYDYHGKVELYNIAADMFEKNDLAKAQPALALAMLVQLTDWLQANCHEAYLPQPNLQFDPQGELPYGPYVPLEQLQASLKDRASQANPGPAQKAQAASKDLPFKGEVFSVDDHTAFLILPEEIESGRPIPWVWYAPTLPGLPGKYEKWMFERFLAQGMAIAGVDVGESYGSPQGRAVYGALYQTLVEERGLAQKACLLARSRGGLMLYNWAAEHPQSVACIAGIYPVCNLNSYPGLDRACKAYGMAETQLADKLHEHNPIDRLAPLAQAKVPIFHIHGDSDEVVPLDRNSAVIKERYDKLGGAMTLDIVKGQGHNLWPSWFQNQDLVDFVISHAKGVPMGEDRPELYPSREDRIRSPGNSIYYVDPINGSDRHSGRERQLAWRSFGRINQLLLGPGDRVEIIAPGSFDQTLVLTGSGRADAPIEVRFAPGRYDFYPNRALRRTYQISNTNDDPDTLKAVGILLEKAKHVSISGPGACLVYRGKMIEVCIDGCQDISISDLQFDYHRPTVSEFRVAAMGDDHVDLQIHPDSHYTIEQGQITWQGEGWRYQTGLAQELDLRSNEVWRRRDPLAGMTLEEIQPQLVRAKGKHNMKAERVYQIRDTRRDCAGVFTRRSQNITWKNVHIKFLHGMGLVNQFVENLTFDTVTVAPDQTSGRTTAAWADCIQVSGCKGKVLVKDCIFSGTHDDAINIHGTHLRVVERLSDTQIKVRFMHAQTFGFLAFNPGDEIALVRWDSLQLYGANRVIEADLINPKEILLKLAQPMPQTFRENDAVENVTWTPEVEIRGCTVSRIPTRGFLITTRRRVLIEDNSFFNTHMSAILVENDAQGWYESGCVRDMTVRGNRFTRCAEPVIHINPQNSLPNQAVHRNIRIEANTFILRDALCMKAKSTTGLTITGNTALSAKRLDEAAAVQTSDCSIVRLEGNRYLPLPGAYKVE